jgi:hypothetical protein
MLARLGIILTVAFAGATILTYALDPLTAGLGAILAGSSVVLAGVILE